LKRKLERQERESRTTEGDTAREERRERRLANIDKERELLRTLERIKTKLRKNITKKLLQEKNEK
jgi:hypothetical protein